MSCIIDLNNVESGIESREHLVFFATNEFIIYKNGLTMEMASCNGEVISTVSLPGDHKQYECLDLDDAVLFLFAGKTIAIIDKYGHEPIKYDLDIYKIGRVINPPLMADDPNRIIIVTRLLERIQIINYDFLDRKRINQTSSWDMSRVNDIIVNKSVHSGESYALIDNSFIVSCNIFTGETLWTRFETGHIADKLIFYKNHLLYTSQNILKKSKNGKVDNIRIPLVRIHNLEQILGDNLYFSSNEGKNLCSYSLKESKLKWEIFGNLPIQETMLTKGSDNKRTYDVMLVRTRNHLGVINLTLGKVVANIRVKNIKRIRETGDHILIHKYGQETSMIPGLKEDES